MVNGLVFLPKYLGETGGCHWFPVEFGKHLRNRLPEVLFDNKVQFVRASPGQGLEQPHLLHSFTACFQPHIKKDKKVP